MTNFSFYSKNSFSTKDLENCTHALSRTGLSTLGYLGLMESIMMSCGYLNGKRYLIVIMMSIRNGVNKTLKNRKLELQRKEIQSSKHHKTTYSLFEYI